MTWSDLGDDSESEVASDGGEESADEVHHSYVEYRCTACGKGHPRNNPPCDRCGNMEFEAVTVEDVDVDDYLPEGPGFPTRELVAAVAIIALVALALALGVVPLGSDWTGPVDPAAVEEVAVGSVDAEREAVGVGSLSTNDRLAAAAARHNRDMISEGYFAQVAPDGEDLSDRVEQANASCGAPREAFTRLGEEPRGSGSLDQRVGSQAVARLLGGRDGRVALLWADAARVGVDARTDGEGRLYVAIVTCGPPM